MNYTNCMTIICEIPPACNLPTYLLLATNTNAISVIASRRRSNPVFEIASVAMLPRNDKLFNTFVLATASKVTRLA